MKGVTMVLYRVVKDSLLGVEAWLVRPEATAEFENMHGASSRIGNIIISQRSLNALWSAGMAGDGETETTGYYRWYKIGF